MAKYQKPDLSKIREVLLYIIENTDTPDKLRIAKIMYWADKYHLEKYGQVITGDWYAALENGPVPSRTYDLIKFVAGERHRGNFDESEKDNFSVSGNNLKNKRMADRKFLSVSNIECIDKAIKYIGSLPIEMVIEMGHDEAFQATKKNQRIDLIKIAGTMDSTGDLVKYLTDC